MAAGVAMQHRSRRRGSSKPFRRTYGTIDPARTVAGRSAARVAHPVRQEKPQYVSRRAHRQRGGRGPRRSSSGRTLLVRFLLVIAVVGAIALTAFLATRPASATITSTPDDAMILFDGSVVGTGTLDVEDLDPGEYSVQIERTGYEPVTATVELKRLRSNKFTYDLEPLPQDITITTHPEGAKVTIAPADGKALTGTGPFSAEVPSGTMKLTIELAGYNTFTRDYAVDSPLELEYYLDPEGQILHGIGLITTLGAPKGVSVTHDGGEAWTSILDGPPSIQIFNPRTGAYLGEIDLGEYGAVEVIFNEAGTLAYTSQMETAKCFEIDVKTRQVLREFDTGSSWTKWVELSPDEKTLYASNWSGDDVSIIDLTTGKLVKRIGVSNTPRGMYATEDGKWLYVAGFDSGDLERINLQTYTRETLFTDGGALRHIVADEKAGRLYISDMANDLIWVHDMNTGTTTKFVDVDEKPNTIDLTPDGKMLFVSCRGENNEKSYYIPGPEWGSILVFDTATGKPLDALIAGNQPTALDVSDDGKLLIFSDFLDNRLRVYEIPSYETFLEGGGGRYEAHFAEIAK
jgi:YVTN family beta-propeller protein